MGGGAPPILQFFLKPLPPPKLMPPYEAPPNLKIKPPPSEKQPPLPLKHETPFHEMIPKKAQ